MRLKSKVAVAIAIAALLVAVSAVAAFAAASQESVALQGGDDMGSGFSSAYGGVVVLQPTCISKIELPGDKFHFQVYVNDVDASGTPIGQVWKDFGDFEDIQLEDTNTVPPFGFRVGMDDWVILGDGSTVHPAFPYQIRCEYKPNVAGLDASGTPKAGASTSPSSFSETETVTLIKNMSTKVHMSTGAIRRAGTTFNFQVSPNCGVGTIKVTIKKTGATTRTYSVMTDEDGHASQKLKLGTKNGAYKVYAKFLGNQFGMSSPTAVKTVRAVR
jgi:opacity protein-like surface antigen